MAWPHQKQNEYHTLIAGKVSCVIDVPDHFYLFIYLFIDIQHAPLHCNTTRFRVKYSQYGCIYRIYSRNSRTVLTKILYLNLGCVIYARKRFYVNKSGYTGNFLNIVLKA